MLALSIRSCLLLQLLLTLLRPYTPSLARGVPIRSSQTPQHAALAYSTALEAFVMEDPR